MNRNIILIALLALLSVGKAAAQSVTVEAKIDSLQILIGDSPGNQYSRNHGNSQ